MGEVALLPAADRRDRGVARGQLSHLHVRAGHGGDAGEGRRVAEVLPAEGQVRHAGDALDADSLRGAADRRTRVDGAGAGGRRRVRAQRVAAGGGRVARFRDRHRDIAVQAGVASHGRCSAKASVHRTADAPDRRHGGEQLPADGSGGRAADDGAECRRVGDAGGGVLPGAHRARRRRKRRKLHEGIVHPADLDARRGDPAAAGRPGRR